MLGEAGAEQRLGNVSMQQQHSHTGSHAASTLCQRWHAQPATR